MVKKGILLINLGTPNDCDKKSVRKYLKTFLNDRRVVDLPYVLRSVLVNNIIVPLRTKKTLSAYKKIWSKAGSPLLLNTHTLTKALASELGNDYQVEFGMRYGDPSIQAGWEKLKHMHSIVVVPLYPQYSSSATGSALDEFLRIFHKEWNMPSLTIKHEFYDDPGFINAYADVIRKHVAQHKIDMIVFSYHGLPLRHIKKSNCYAHCDDSRPCPMINDRNLYCYRAQCFATSRLIAKQLNLKSDQYIVSFQSRLGRTPWIKPYTDLVLPGLIEQGIKNIAMVSPSFIADCLETLEEVNIRTRNAWQALGGENFIFVPCLNDSPIWVKALAEMIKAGPIG
jgi:ferrochelatase